MDTQRLQNWKSEDIDEFSKMREKHMMNSATAAAPITSYMLHKQRWPYLEWKNMLSSVRTKNNFPIYLLPEAYQGRFVQDRGFGCTLLEATCIQCVTS